jgi:hypothetical protein
MLRDAKGWVEKLPITRQLRDQMIVETVKRITRKLDAVKELLKVNGYEDICAGLYTFALEEYGKVVLLQSYPTADTIEIHYKYGFRDHKRKFPLAKNKLPTECMQLHDGGFDRNSFDAESFDVDVVADLDSRLGIFYTDFTDSADRIKGIPVVDKLSLRNAVQKFEMYLAAQKFP